MKLPFFLVPQVFVMKKLERILKQHSLEHLRKPFDFLFTKRISPEDRLIVDKIEVVRSELLADEATEVGIHHSPQFDSGKMTSTVATRLSPSASQVDSLQRIASHASIHPYWGTFLYLCANAVPAHSILELGSCAGISGSYLASGKSCQRFISVEGSPGLAAVAQSNIRRSTGRGELLNTSFDEAIDQIPALFNRSLDLVYIDGQHVMDATLHYFERVIPFLSKGAIVIFDDIYWSRGMIKAWKWIRRWKGCSLTLDLGRLGLIVWGGDVVEPRRYSFKLFTDHWGKGNSI